MKIFVVGDVMLDGELRGRFRENYEGATLCITGQHWRYYPGGAANTAAILRGLGHQVNLFGVVGPDWAAGQLERLLGSIEHRLKALLPITTVKLRAYAEDKLISRVDCEKPIPSDWAVAACYQTGTGEGVPDCVVCSDYAKGVFGRHCQSTLRRIIEWDCPVVVDPGPRDYVDIWDGATVATPNLREAQLMQIGTKHLVVTKSSEGAEVWSGGNCRHISCSPVSDAQIVGAGDAFTAGLAAGLAQGQDIYQAAEFAVKSATDYVSHPRRENYALERD